MASLPQRRFMKRPVNPTSPNPKKLHTDLGSIIFTGEEYEHQKGDLAGNKTGNVGATLDFHKTLNAYVSNAVKHVVGALRVAGASKEDAGPAATGEAQRKTRAPTVYGRQTVQIMPCRAFWPTTRTQD